MKHRPHLLALGLAFTLLLPAQSPGQDSWNPHALRLERVELLSLADRYDAAAASVAYSDSLRTYAALQSAQIRRRLAEGDFQVGDQIHVSVEGHEQLTDTFTVGAGRRLTLPVVGDVRLDGVLRSELEGHLRRRIGELVLDAIVYTRPLIRIAVVGAVGRPGFYALPPEGQLDDALMLAGGPSPQADLGGVSVERAEERVWAPGTLQEAIAHGRTLDELDLRSGDRIVVPAKARFWNRAELARWLMFGAPTLLLTLIRIF